MKAEHIVIVDAYNVIHRLPHLEARMETSLQSAREGLVQICRDWLALRRDIDQFLLVFDGDSSVTDGPSQPARNIRMIYTHTDEAADDRILAVVSEYRRVHRCTVVSDDNRVIQGAKDRQATPMSVATFYSTVRHTRQHRTPAPTEDDKTLSPRDQKAINDDLKKAWGIE